MGIPLWIKLETKSKELSKVPKKVVISLKTNIWKMTTLIKSSPI